MTSSSDKWAGPKLDLGRPLSLLPRTTHPHIGMTARLAANQCVFRDGLGRATIATLHPAR